MAAAASSAVAKAAPPFGATDRRFPLYHVLLASLTRQHLGLPHAHAPPPPPKKSPSAATAAAAQAAAAAERDARQMAVAREPERARLYLETVATFWMAQSPPPHADKQLRDLRGPAAPAPTHKETSAAVLDTLRVVVRLTNEHAKHRVEIAWRREQRRASAAAAAANPATPAGPTTAAAAATPATAGRDGGRVTPATAAAERAAERLAEIDARGVLRPHLHHFFGRQVQILPTTSARVAKLISLTAYFLKPWAVGERPPASAASTSSAAAAASAVGGGKKDGAKGAAAVLVRPPPATPAERDAAMVEARKWAWAPTFARDFPSMGRLIETVAVEMCESRFSVHDGTRLGQGASYTRAAPPLTPRSLPRHR